VWQRPIVAVISIHTRAALRVSNAYKSHWDAAARESADRDKSLSRSVPHYEHDQGYGSNQDKAVATLKAKQFQNAVSAVAGVQDEMDEAIKASE